MKNTKAPASRNQVLAPVIIVVIGVAIVGTIAYVGRSEKKSEPAASAGAPGSARTNQRQRDPNRPNRPNRDVAKAAPPDVVYDLKGDPVKGDKNAPVVLIEFSDYQCPFCARHVRETWPRLEEEYVKTGKVRFAFRDFPLEMHKQAFKAAEAAHCAADQGKFWEMHDLLFANQQALDVENLVKHAGTLKLNTAKFKQCLDSSKYAQRVRDHMADGQKAGARGTPYFVLGTAEPNSTKVKAVKTINGAHPYSAFKSAIEELLGNQQ